MPNVRYFCNRLKEMDYHSMLDRVSIVHHKCGKSKLFILLDMIWCGFRYGAGYVDYDVIGFYKLSTAQRKTMLTRGKNNQFVQELNDKEYWHVFNNKNEFDETFLEYVQRDFVYPVSNNLEKVEEFLQKHPIFFAKPNDGQCGKNIEKLNAEDYKKEELIDYLKKNELELLEEPVIQCEEMNRLNPSSVNTVRMVTVKNEEGEVTIIATFSRIGNGKVVDNFNSGGMTARVDVDTGVIVEPAVDKEGTVYFEHPITGTKIEGFQIPYWDEAKAMVVSAAQKSDHIRYIGWDVGLSEHGPVLVEGNHFPGHDIYQVAEKIGENDIGILPRFEEAIYGNKFDRQLRAKKKVRE